MKTSLLYFHQKSKIKIKYLNIGLHASVKDAADRTEGLGRRTARTYTIVTELKMCDRNIKM